MLAFIFFALGIAAFLVYPILTFILYTLIAYTFFSQMCIRDRMYRSAFASVCLRTKFAGTWFEKERLTLSLIHI